MRDVTVNECSLNNSGHVNKGKIHRITISLGPCGKLGATNWGVQEAEAGNIHVVFD